MSSLNTNTARVIDPVLSGIAQGYRHAQRVGHVLFPAIDVIARGGRVIEFGRESFFNYRARRAPGADAITIQFGYEGKPFSLEQFSLDVPVPREHAEEATAVPGIDLGTLRGHPFVEPARWEGSKRSWVYGVTYERAPVLTGIASGFLFQGITG